MSICSGIIRGLFNAVFQPAELVKAHTATRRRSWLERIRQLWSLGSIYLVNLVLYAGPLTLAGFGRQSVPAMPGWFGDLVQMSNNDAVWQLSYAFLQNSLYLLVATVLTFVTFHFGVLLVLQSQGILQTAYTVVFSTSTYLAGIFTVIWYLSMSSGVTAARTLVIDLQKLFIYRIIDYLGADLGLPGGRPDRIEVQALTPEGEFLISILLVLAIYYFYSLYLGARINHSSNRIYSVLITGFVAISPVIYVVGTVIAHTSSLVPTL